MEIYIPKVAFFATVPGYTGLINLYKFPLDNFHLQDLLNRTLGTFKSGIDDFVGTLCASLTNSKRLCKFAGALFFRTAENTIMIFFILIKLCKGPISTCNPLRLRNEFI